MNTIAVQVIESTTLDYALLRFNLLKFPLSRPDRNNEETRWRNSRDNGKEKKRKRIEIDSFSVFAEIIAAKMCL